MQEERLEREADLKRMMSEDQHAAGGYNSHRNYQNLSARSPDTIDEVRHAAGPTLPKTRLFFAALIGMDCCGMAAQSRRIYPHQIMS